jgi:hypothetical protein
MEIIAEVKTKSPFGWESGRTWEELFEIAVSIGDMISVHTDPRWGGSFELLERARAMTNLPILAKGLHSYDDDIRRALDLGANKVLVVGRIPGVAPKSCLLEPLNLRQLASFPLTQPAVWNTRDLVTGGLKHETFDQARTLTFGWLCQASNIATWEDVHPGANAILVGQHMPEFAVLERP